MFMASFRLNLENEHISVDAALRVRTLQCICVYVRYNALYIKIFALYNNILLWRLVKTENRFSTTENQFGKKLVSTSLAGEAAYGSFPSSGWECSSIKAQNNLPNIICPPSVSSGQDYVPNRVHIPNNFSPFIILPCWFRQSLHNYCQPKIAPCGCCQSNFMK